MDAKNPTKIDGQWECLLNPFLWVTKTKAGTEEPRGGKGRLHPPPAAAHVVF